MRYPLILDVGTRFFHRLSDHLGRGLLGLTDRAHTHRHAKEVLHGLSRGPLGQAICATTQRHRGVHARTVGATGNPLGPGRTRRLATSRAHQLMPLILGHHRFDRRNLDDLMTKRRRIISCEGGAAAGTLLGFDRHHLIDFFYWEKRARLASVPRLTPSPAPTAGAFGASSLRWIARRRT